MLKLVKLQYFTTFQYLQHSKYTVFNGVKSHYAHFIRKSVVYMLKLSAGKGFTTFPNQTFQFC